MTLKAVAAAVRHLKGTPSAAAVAEVTPERDYRYCTEVLIWGVLLPPATGPTWCWS